MLWMYIMICPIRRRQLLEIHRFKKETTRIIESSGTLASNSLSSFMKLNFCSKPAHRIQNPVFFDEWWGLHLCLGWEYWHSVILFSIVPVGAMLIKIEPRWRGTLVTSQDCWWMSTLIIKCYWYSTKKLSSSRKSCIFFKIPNMLSEGQKITRKLFIYLLLFT